MQPEGYHLLVGDPIINTFIPFIYINYAVVIISRSKMAAAKLSKDIIQSFIESFDTILVDCDGCLLIFQYSNVLLNLTTFTIFQEFSGLVANW